MTVPEVYRLIPRPTRLPALALAASGGAMALAGSVGLVLVSAASPEPVPLPYGRPESKTVQAQIQSTAVQPPPPPAPAAPPAPKPAAAAAPVAPPAPAPPARPAFNPFRGAVIFNPAHNPAAAQAAAWRTSRPADAARMDKIAASGKAVWMGSWSGDIRGATDTLVSSATARGQLPVLVAYNIPHRDCGSHSAGGAGSAAAYRAWIDGMASGIGGRRAVVILEPDALALGGCLSPAQKEERYALLRHAVSALTARGASVYIDAGHPQWIAAGEMAARLQRAGVAGAQGFSLNVSNFIDTASNVRYGNIVGAKLGGKHFVVDTSRNGRGSSGQWCNPEGRALGSRPAAGSGLLDAILWIKYPGESDGTCGGGPGAGTFWPEYALGLAARAGY